MEVPEKLKEHMLFFNFDLFCSDGGARECERAHAKTASQTAGLRSSI
jgi:hypothetical protein